MRSALEVTTELDEQTDSAEGSLHRINERRAIRSMRCLRPKRRRRDVDGEDAYDVRSR
jgi:hypothetical protein